MNESIKHQFFFPHPPMAVWEYLTVPALMEQWLMKNDFQPVVGLDFQFRTNLIPGLYFGQERYCSLKKDGFEDLLAWLAYFDQFWNSKLKKLENLLNNKLTN
jgi:hypothetical protein